MLTQLPQDAQVFLDHVGHFVADADAAAGALRRVGFTPTPVSVQVNPDPAGGPPRLTGTGNVCAMLRRGYLEVLFRTADTPLGRELDGGRARYPGLHLVALAVADAPAAHARLASAGFRMQPVVDMRRPVATETGEGVAAFEVVRLEPGQMPEGRIQVLRHLTEDTVWQPRWLDHPNTAIGLVGVTLVLADPVEATARYRRFTVAVAQPLAGDGSSRIVLDRGFIEMLSPQAFRERRPAAPLPSLPFIAEATIAVRSLDAAAAALAAGGLPFERQPACLFAPFPADLGVGTWRFVPDP